MPRSSVFGVNVRNFSTLFICLFGFYLVLSGGIDRFAVGTGLVSAAVVAFVFAGITFSSPSDVGGLVGSLSRAVLYVPFLFWEIVKANFSIAYLALHPSVPLDPSIAEYEPKLKEAGPLTTFALSVTLTPGTLVVDVRDGVCHVHSLTSESVSDLFEGRLERAVEFVFEGRRERQKATNGAGEP